MASLAFSAVIPAKAGTRSEPIKSREAASLPCWVPAFAGVTEFGYV